MNCFLCNQTEDIKKVRVVLIDEYASYSVISCQSCFNLYFSDYINSWVASFDQLVDSEIAGVLPVLTKN